MNDARGAKAAIYAMNEVYKQLKQRPPPVIINAPRLRRSVTFYGTFMRFTVESMENGPRSELLVLFSAEM